MTMTSVAGWLLAIGALSTCASMAMAQSAGVQAPPADCRVAPDAGDPARDNPVRGENDARPPAGNNLLAECGSVLAPPITGDAEMVEPAPDKGRTPVIDPSEVRPEPQ